MKFMVLGAGGLMGRHLVGELKHRRAPHSAYLHADLDICDAAAATRALTRECPEWVINCAALCSFDACEENPELSRKVNLEAPILWAKLCHARGVRIAHFSSDYIYSGDRHTPFRETDPPSPLGVYAAHKAETEQAFSEFPEHLILRVAWLFGKGGSTFMSQMPQLLMTREELTVASGKRGKCLYADYGTHLALALIARDACGIVNTVHSGETSWEEFAEECLRQLKARGLEPKCRSIRKVPLDQIPALKAGRPAYSVLDTDKLESMLGAEPLPWTEGIRQYLDALLPTTRVDLTR
jgi:dTDP-4-dehydrorhamnose reductase